MTMTHIATLVGVTTAGITGSADQLEKLGFVERVHSTLDRRSVYLVATRTGREAVQDLQDKVDALSL